MADFLGESVKYKDSKVVILPVPYDGTSTYVKGADKGPKAIIDASMEVERYDAETDSNLLGFGICTLSSLKNAASVGREMDLVYSEVKKLLDDDKFVVMLGGEHSISYGAVKAHKDKFSDLSVLQIDAHDDLREEFEGSKFNHACVMSRIKESGCKTVQVGVRSVNEDCPDKVKKQENIFYAWNMEDDSWMDDAVAALGDDVYISFDLDGFDPSIMPSTGTPEPGGMLWYQTLRFLRKVFEKKNVVGFDVVELCPIKGMVAPDFMAAKLIYKMINYKYNLK